MSSRLVLLALLRNISLTCGYSCIKHRIRRVRQCSCRSQSYLMTDFQFTTDTYLTLQVNTSAALTASPLELWPSTWQPTAPCTERYCLDIGTGIIITRDDNRIVKRCILCRTNNTHQFNQIVHEITTILILVWSGHPSLTGHILYRT